MNELQLALLAVAAVLLVALVAYNKWQEWRALRELDASLRDAVNDALLRPEPAAPPAGVPPVAGPARAATARVEPSFGPPADDMPGPAGVPAEAPDSRPAAAPLPAPSPGELWVEDPMLDCVLELRCVHPVDGVAVFDAAAPLMRLDVALPVFVVAWDARTQQWVQPDRFGFYTELLIAIQLTHRGQTLDEISASRFIAGAQQVAAALDADLDLPDVARIVQMAQQLDRLCAQFDVQIGLTLEAQEGPWQSSRVSAAAYAAGLDLRETQQWLRYGQAGLPLFTLSAPALVTERLLLELDVPLAPAAEDALGAMFSTANQLAAQLHARIVDDNGRPITPESLQSVRAGLEALYAQMRTAGIEPGSVRAQRLYG
jgi:hypothetical protein